MAAGSAEEYDELIAKGKTISANIQVFSTADRLKFCERSWEYMMRRCRDIANYNKSLLLGPSEHRDRSKIDDFCETIRQLQELCYFWIGIQRKTWKNQDNTECFMAFSHAGENKQTVSMIKEKLESKISPVLKLFLDKSMTEGSPAQLMQKAFTNCKYGYVDLSISSVTKPWPFIEQLIFSTRLEIKRKIDAELENDPILLHYDSQFKLLVDANDFTDWKLKGFEECGWIDIVKRIPTAFVQNFPVAVKREKLDDLDHCNYFIEKIIQTTGITVLSNARPHVDFLLENQIKTTDPQKATECQRLKEIGNELYNLKRYSDAVDKYSDAISLGVSNDELTGILYNNRAAAYYEWANTQRPDTPEQKQLLKRGKRDADQACKLRPDWSKCHQRLGKIYGMLYKYERAVVCLERAYVLCPEDNIKEELSRYRMEQGKSKRDESSNLQYHYSSQFLEAKNVLATSMGIKNPTEYLHQVSELFMNSNKTEFQGIGWCGKGHEATLHGNFKEALQCFSAAANIGDSEGMYNLALACKEGRGCKVDINKSIYWLRKACECDPHPLGPASLSAVPFALHSLALCYQEGVGVQKDVAKAIPLWKKAADEMNFAPSQNCLGVFYLRGEGVSFNLHTACQYFRIAAENGAAVAMYNLGECYMNGTGVDLDFRTALKWLTAAKNAGYLNADLLIDRCKQRCKEENDINGVFSARDHDCQKFSRSLAKCSNEYLAKVNAKQCTGPALKINERDRFNRTTLSAVKSPYTDLLLMALDVFETCNQELSKHSFFALPSLLQQCSEAMTMHGDCAVVGFRCDPTVMLFAEYICVGSVGRLISNAEERRILERTFQLAESYGDRDNLRLWAFQIRVHSLNHDIPATVHFLELCLKEWPDNPYFKMILGSYLCFESPLQNYLEAIRLFEGARFHNYELYKSSYYSQASAERQAGLLKESSINYDKFLETCIEGHRKIPGAYFGKAINRIIECFQNSEFKNFRRELIQSKGSERISEIFEQYAHYLKALSAHTVMLEIKQLYQQGIAEEKKIHPSLNADSSLKQLLEIIVNSQDIIDKIKSSGTQRDSKIFAPDWQRGIIKRNLVHSIRNSWENSCILKKSQLTTYVSPTFPQIPAVNRACDFREIFLDDIFTKGKEMVHKNCVLKCMIITIPIKLHSWMTVVCDGVGDIERLAIYNLPLDDVKRFKFGTILKIYHPYFRFAVDGKPMIRVDNPASCIEILETKPACWYCLKEKELKTCNRCKLATYCSADCQRKDWKDLWHNKECQFLQYQNQLSSINAPVLELSPMNM